MLFSIIIPTYNRAALIEGTLRSVLNQEFHDFEIVLVDDGSKDQTEEVVKKINSEKIKYFYKTNEERAVARNFGAEKSTGDYLIFLDSDDNMAPKHLSSIYAFLSQHQFLPEFIFTGYQIFNTEGKPVYEYGFDGYFDGNKLAYGNFLGCSSMVVKKQLFNLYKFNTEPKLILFEDWELWLRILSGHQLHCIPSKSIIMVNHDGRSVLNFETAYMVDRVNCLKNIVLHQKGIVSASFLNKRIFLMGLYSYAALHLAMTKKSRLSTLKYLLLSFINHPGLIFKKRFYGILKHLI